MNRLSAVVVALLFASLPVVHAVELKLSYDANGNLVTGDGKYRVYNGLNQLARVYNGTNATGLLLEEYSYHPTQERILVKKVYNNDTSLKETVYYISQTFVQVVNSSGTYNTTYVYHDGQLVAQNTNGTKLFIHGDQKGSTTVVTSDATAGNTSGTLPQQIFQDSFCSSDRGYTGYDARDSGQCSLNKTNSYGNIYSPNEGFETNYADSVADFNLTLVFRYPGGTNNKFYPTVTCASLGSTSNRFNLEQGNSTHFHIKADRGGWSSTNDVPYNTTQTAKFETNATTNRSRACIGTSCTNWETYARDAGAEDCFATSFTSISGGAFQIYNVTGWQNLKAYNTTGTNVTIIETNAYSPFGERLNAGSVRFGYEAKEADSVVGDTDFTARKYRPDLGLYAQPDTIFQNAYDPQLLNRYSFERNSPYRYTDPTGRDVIGGEVGYQLMFPFVGGASDSFGLLIEPEGGGFVYPLGITTGLTFTLYHTQYVDGTGIAGTVGASASYSSGTTATSMGQAQRVTYADLGPIGDISVPKSATGQLDKDHPTLSGGVAAVGSLSTGTYRTTPLLSKTVSVASAVNLAQKATSAIGKASNKASGSAMGIVATIVSATSKVASTVKSFVSGFLSAPGSTKSGSSGSSKN